jgi:hypothetical protein
MIWIVGMIVVLLLSAVGIIYVISRTRRLGFVKKVWKKNKLLGAVLSLLPILLCLPFGIINIWSVIIVLLHLILIWALCDFVGFIVNKIRKRERRKNYINGFIAIAITVVYMGYGWFCAHYVFQTDYTMQTEKNVGTESLRIVEIADLHLGITLDGDGFAKQCERVNETNPDVVVVCGDFVDDDSKRADMIKACNALGTLQTKYGVYWIYGNHDRGYYNYRDFTTDELIENLEKNNVKVLTDESVLIDDTFYIVGRDDRSIESRMSAEQLTNGLDKSKYIIMLDHQPNDYDNEMQSGADLVLSGHTHGGHIFPAGIIGILTKANDKVYGTEKRDTTDFTVSSGISGWAIPFKTFCISEFVVIDVTQNSK